MREIKFRAWNKDTKSMDYNPTIDGFEVGIVALNNFAHQHSSKIILMQFTGLEDDDGLGVYEGDIIKYKSQDETNYHFSEVKMPLIYTFMNNFIEKQEVKIVGNVYENKELLDKIKE